MKLPKKIGTLLLCIWLIAWGAVGLVPALTFNGSGTILAILAVAAGVAILLDQ
jgi:hypothetical protein